MRKYAKFSIVIITFLLLYFPIVVIALLSVNASQTGVTFTDFTFRWYQEVIQNDSLRGAILNTLLIAVTSTVISTILGTFISIGIFSFKLKYRSKLILINNFPIVNADISTAIILMIIFTIINIKFGFTTMLLAHIFFSIPFVILSIIPRLREVDEDLFDAAIDLGCSKFQALYKVIIPSIKTGIITGALIAFTMSIDDFVISWFNTGNGFDNFSIWIYARLGRKTFSPAAYAYNTIITVLTITILIIYNIKSIRRVNDEKNN